jgi:hypothetical protein
MPFGFCKRTLKVTCGSIGSIVWPHVSSCSGAVITKGASEMKYLYRVGWSGSWGRGLIVLIFGMVLGMIS